jgi:hypothetical protein
VTAEYGSCKWKEQIESLIYDEDERGDREELFINHLNGGEPPKEQKTHPADTDPQIAVDVCEWQVKRFENIATRNPERMGIVATAKALLATARAQLAAFEADDPDWYKIGEAA